jgi:membrane protein YdbS with pleckstrin-like domain
VQQTAQTAQTARGLLDGAAHGLDPRVRTVWGLGAALATLLPGLAGTIALAAIGAPPALTAALGALTAVATIVAIAWTQVAVRRWWWRAWPDALELHHGVLIARESLVPYDRIQQIDVVRDPLERFLGLATLVLRTAAASTDARVPGIRAEVAASLRPLLLERAHADDAV